MPVEFDIDVGPQWHVLVIEAHAHCFAGKRVHITVEGICNLPKDSKEGSGEGSGEGALITRWDGPYCGRRRAAVTIWSLSPQGEWLEAPLRLYDGEGGWRWSVRAEDANPNDPNADWNDAIVNFGYYPMATWAVAGPRKAPGASKNSPLATWIPPSRR